ncbi:hypothetical protein ACJRO7_023735 [Eucalyptus globulus]|uniref:peptidylprolyl isomerase n=1 Tax=Eucalyptus globulus TaxID=34317 RepID=A0ABD3K3Z8_EUCGL
MASVRSFRKLTALDGRLLRPAAALNRPPDQLTPPARAALRRLAVLISLLPWSSEARERCNRKFIPPEEYSMSPIPILATADGVKYYDIIEGKGPVATKGSTVRVHFDCIYRGITAVSSRESKLLAGNRIIAQPYEFKVGSPPGKERKRGSVDNPNGLFSAQAAPKPPPAMYSITEGMKVGGNRTAIVPLEVGYGQKGMAEIPEPPLN